MAWNDRAVLPALETAWNYMRLVHRPARADAILTLGSFDPHAAVHAAALWRRRLAPVVIMSGGIAHRGGMLETGWDRSEAHVFADVAMREGVPETALLLEDRAQNTGDNFTMGLAVAERAGLRPKTLLVVAKPYMTRRGFATGRKLFPAIEFLMQCEEIEAGRYFTREADPERAVLALVGDLHRIVVYPKLGFQIEQDVPADVTAAFDRLVAAGYGRRLVAGT